MDAQHRFRQGLELARLGRRRQALSAFRQVTELAPSAASGWANRASVAAELGVLDEPERCYRKAVQLAPDEPKHRIRLGFLLLGQGRLDEAELLFTSARGPEAACGMAQVLEHRGELQSALTVLQPVLGEARDFPRLGVVFARVARRLGHPQEGVALLRVLPSSPEVLFERGHCLDALGHAGSAWTCFEQANAALGLGFDPEAFLAEVWAERRLRGTSSSDLDGHSLVFIVGMPRSGTSLVEQILSRHPQVHAAGEREVVPRIARELARQGWPELYSARLNQLGRRVLADLPPGRICTDKMPDNWRHIPLIRRMLPGARVVHCRRDLHDCRLSNFMQHYASAALAWSTSIEGLNAYAQAYCSADIGGIELHYEELVASPEPHIRRLLEALDLPFHPACLSPEASDRTVATASYAQVQAPIHTRSVGRAQAYRSFLAA